MSVACVTHNQSAVSALAQGSQETELQGRTIPLIQTVIRVTDRCNNATIFLIRKFKDFSTSIILNRVEERLRAGRFLDR